MNLMMGDGSATILLFGIAGLLCVGFAIYWRFDKQAKLRHIAEFRKKLDELHPTDPEYGAVRALYTSMVIDAHRWGHLSSDSGSDDHGGDGGHGGGEHSGGHGGDGGGGGDGH